MSGLASLAVLAVTGMKAEARVAAGAGITTLVSGGDSARLALLLQAYLTGGAKAVISIGIAGGLAPELPAGTIVVADAVEDGETRWAVNPAWRHNLRSMLPAAVSGDISGVDRAVADRHAKASLYRRSGALAVDMESHVAARLAAQHRVPFAALRIIADPAERTLPRAALDGMRPDGGTDIAAVLRALVLRPSDLPGLIHTAFDARAAFATLKRSRLRIGEGLGFGEPTRDRPDIAVDDAIGLTLPAEVQPDLSEPSFRRQPAPEPAADCPSPSRSSAAA